jgi:putative ubiquitin-RnfH superfamily antitoxin RatB of RatAB toxin-antitoxin module
MALGDPVHQVGRPLTEAVVTEQADPLTLQVSVVWVDDQGEAHRLAMSLPPGASLRSVGDWLSASGEHPVLAQAWSQAAGYAVFGHLKDLDASLGSGDRIEILAPLEADPKEARQQRVNSVRRARAQAGAFDRWTRAR